MYNIKSFWHHIKTDFIFFLNHFYQTFTLNSISIIIKFILTLLWGYLDNARLLGYFSLASVPSSIVQRGMIAGLIAQTKIPSLSSRAQESELLKSALWVDLIITSILSVIIFIFFIISKAQIINTLGYGLVFFLLLLGLLENFPSLGTASCIANRKYLWNFLLVNTRLIGIIIFLCLIMNIGIKDAKIGALIWVFSVFVAVITAFLYFRTHELPFLNSVADKKFTEEIKQNFINISFYRISALLFGILPAIFISRIKNVYDVGLVSFAFTLSNFIYISMVPSIEQIFNPSLSLLAEKRNGRQELVSKVLQMTIISFILTSIVSFILLFFSKFLLKYIGKTQFVESLSFLPYLILYQIFIATAGGFTYTIFCLKEYILLSVVYLIPFSFVVIMFLYNGEVSFMLKSLMFGSILALVLAILVFVYLLNSRKIFQRTILI